MALKASFVNNFTSMTSVPLIHVQLPGLLVAAGTIGLISSDQKDLQMIFKVILDSKPWHTNHNVVELPWRQEKVDHIYERSPHPGIHDGRLTFGMMKDDEGMSPFPDIRCALDKVEKCLKDCGHEVSTLWYSQELNV